MGAVTSMSNDTPFYVTKQRVAHKPGYGAEAECGEIFQPGQIERMEYAQLLVWVKPTFCPFCFPGGVS